MIKKREEDAGDVRLTRREQDEMEEVEEKKEVVVHFDSTQELKVSKQSLQGHLWARSAVLPDCETACEKPFVFIACWEMTLCMV